MRGGTSRSVVAYLLCTACALLTTDIIKVLLENSKNSKNSALGRKRIPRISHHRGKTLVLLSDHQPPDTRLSELLIKYKRSLEQYDEYDLYFFCTDNFDFRKEVSACRRAAELSNDIPYLLPNASLTREIFRRCTFCQSRGPWAWATYMKPLVAFRHFQALQEHTPYEYVWTLEPDSEFLGDVGRWFHLHDRNIESQLLSYLVFHSVARAKEYLEPGMVALIFSRWRWWEELPHGPGVNFGVVPFLARLSSTYLDEMDNQLGNSTFGDIFFSYVCRELGERACAPKTIPYKDIGYLSAHRKLFVAERNATAFKIIAQSPSNWDKWYHPLKFAESWSSLPAINGTPDAIEMCSGTPHCIPECDGVFQTDRCTFSIPSEN